MSIESSVTIADGHVQANGTRRVRYEFTDHLGDTHGIGPHKLQNYVTTPFDNSDGFDIIYSEEAGESLIWDGSMWQILRIYTYEPQILAQLAASEINYVTTLLGQGVNIFTTPADHQTNDELYKAVIDFYAVMEFDEMSQYTAAIPILSGLTNPFVTGLGYVWQNWQAWDSNLDTLNVAKTNYQPMAGV